MPEIIIGVDSAGSTWVTKPDSAGIRVSHSMPRTPKVSPPTISGLGPVLGSTCDTTAAARMMPPLNGWQFHAEQMKDPELARIPVIVMTAAASYWGLPDGVNAYLQKPFDLEALFSEIERVSTE